MNQHQQQRQGWITALLKKYEQSGLKRAEFSRREGISVSTLDYYRRQQARRGHEQQSEHPQRLVRVRVNRAEITPCGESTGFAVVLQNGRRIECGANFDEFSLERLIRIAERAL
jgi:D-alanyl-D-alanine dipeptidase